MPLRVAVELQTFLRAFKGGRVHRRRQRDRLLYAGHHQLP